MVPARRPLVAALRELAAPDGPADLDAALAPLADGRADELIAAVVRHRLEGALVDAATRAGLDVPEAVADIVADDRLVRLQVQAALDRVADALDGVGIPWLTFKGPVVAALMTRPELRTYNDLDILVAADRFGPAIEALAGAGVEELNENWEPYLRHRVGEVPMAAGPVSVDLHWHVIGLAHHRRSLRFDPTAMIERRRSVMVAGRELPVFDATDQLLHLAVHTAMSGATRLDQLRDLAVVMDRDPVDWDEFARRARQAGAARLSSHALDRAGRVLGAPVDEATLRSLAGGSLDRRRRLDGDRVATLRGIGVWWRRDSVAASMMAAANRLLGRLPGRRRGWDFVDEDSHLFHAHRSGGPSVRAEYLRRIVDWA